MDKLKQIESFVGVATKGSLTAAARAEGVAPAVIGRRVDGVGQWVEVGQGLEPVGGQLHGQEDPRKEQDRQGHYLRLGSQRSQGESGQGIAPDPTSKQ